MSDSLRNLCGFVSGFSVEHVDAHTLSHTRNILVDTIGVIVAGSALEEVGRLRDALCAGDGRGEASCLGSTVVTSALNAALLNGVSGSSLEFEEGNTWAMGHPAIQVIPSLLAVCETRGCSGGELLAGLIAGYESAARIGRAATLRKGVHPTGSWGAIGAALGVGRLFHRTADELYQIANIASSFAISPCVKNSFVGMNVAFVFAGVTNHVGVLSNMLYDCGIRADETSFTATFSKFIGEHLREEALDEALGKEYLITSNYLKPYPSCRFTHSPIDALQAILQKVQLVPEEIDVVTVGTFQAGMHCETKTPPNTEAVRFSTPYLLAILMRHGAITPEIMSSVSVSDPAYKALADKVEMQLVAQYEALRPAQNPTRVTVRLKDGTEWSHEVMNASGDAVLPLTETDISRKFISLVAPVIGEAQGKAFIEGSSHLEKAKDINRLIDLLHPQREEVAAT